MGNLVIYTQRGQQFRTPAGRYAPRMVPPAKAVAIGPNPPTRPNVVPVEHDERGRGQGAVPVERDPNAKGPAVHK